MIFSQKRRPRVRLWSRLGHFAKSAGRVVFGVVTYDFWPKAQAAGQRSDWFWPLSIFGQKHRPRVRLWSRLGHSCFFAKSAGRVSVFGVVSFTYDFWPKVQGAGQASE